MSADQATEILVAGTGPAGMIAALALADAGFEVVLAGPRPTHEDRRTTALMMPAMTLMERIGLADDLKADAAPLKTMRIIDATSRLIRSPVVTFRSSDIGEEAFGYNIPNMHLSRQLERAVQGAQGISWRQEMVRHWQTTRDAVEAEMEDGSRISAKLAVAADGRLSPARGAAGIRAFTRDRRQSALVLNFMHTRDHAGISTEFHTETGPFTQVPLPSKRSSLVWVVRPGTARELLALDDQELSRRIEEKMQSMLGKVEVEPGRQIYPLSSALPMRFARNRIALVGEAAHVFPPIGAQGLNLGIRDIEDLVASTLLDRNDPGSGPVMWRYDAKRRPDVMARSTAVNMLNMSLLTDFLPAQLLRTAGLSVIGNLAPVRSFFMREGLHPGSGWKNLFSDLRKEVRR
ncbi:MAG TPA: UbiH/UbiF family hydroxylase [Rhizobiaceae bacterium]|nr:UbiH/UbiF family hydroxylase [Rhizobiaceae bacterium]